MHHGYSMAKNLYSDKRVTWFYAKKVKNNTPTQTKVILISPGIILLTEVSCFLEVHLLFKRDTQNSS